MFKPKAEILSEIPDLSHVEKVNDSLQEGNIEDIEAIPSNVIPIFGDAFNEETNPDLIKITQKEGDDQ